MAPPDVVKSAFKSKKKKKREHVSGSCTTLRQLSSDNEEEKYIGFHILFYLKNPGKTTATVVKSHLKENINNLEHV